jgi:LacI family transcriptional regulator
LATLKDISLKVGVSISTVSRVINNDTSRPVSEETKEKIWAAADELGYKPNLWARQLVKGSAYDAASASERITGQGQVGCIVSVPQHNYTYPYFSTVLKGIEAGLAKDGYSLAYVHTVDEIQDPMIMQKIVDSRAIEGMIIVEGIKSDIYDFLKQHLKVLVGIDINDPTIPTVSYDRVSAAKAAVTHLIQQGHRKIAFIGGLGLTGQIRKEKRFRGYKEALEEAGIELNDEWILNADWKIENSYELMKQLIAKSAGDRPTAIFAASDVMAISAMRAAEEMKIAIPDEMAFIGVDNIDISLYTSPPLSTIHVPKYEIGFTAAGLLADYLKERYTQPMKVIIPYELMIRQSSVKA